MTSKQMRRRLKVVGDVILGAAFIAWSLSFLDDSVSSALFVGLIGVMWLVLAAHDGGMLKTATRARAFVAITGFIFGGLAASTLVGALSYAHGPALRAVGFLGGAFLAATAALLLFRSVRGPRVKH